MANPWFLAHIVLLCFAVQMMAFNHIQIKADPKTGQIAGVFLVPEEGRYTLNATVARDACLFLNSTLATQSQLQSALQQGLETCRYGWIDGNVAVLPRITAVETCGKGKVGLAKWYASPDTLFAAFCFNTENTTAAIPGAATRATLRRPVATVPSHATAGASARPSLTRSAATHSTGGPAEMSASSGLTPTTSPPGRAATVSSAGVSLGAGYIALIVIGIIFLLLTAGTMGYYKLKKGVLPNCSWRQKHQMKDDAETDMWRQSEITLQVSGEDEEESSKKYSSDVTHCVNPDNKTLA